MGKIKDFFVKAWNAIRNAVSRVFSLGADKYLHFIAGAAITALCALIPYFAPFALTFGVVAGVIKEVVDYFAGGCVEKGDVIATALGSFAMQFCIWGYLIFW